MTILLSCDIGYRNLGFSVIEAEKENLKLLYAENFVTTGKTISENLSEIATHFKQLVKQYKPNTYIFEDPVMKGATGAKLNQVIGVLRYLSYKYELAEFCYKPTEVKKAVTSGGGADKQQVIDAVEKVFPERKFPLRDNHCADSTAVALCHIYKTKIQIADS
jgi:crossover junction endodeoxyribonuclease RuvC